MSTGYWFSSKEKEEMEGSCRQGGGLLSCDLECEWEEEEQVESWEEQEGECSCDKLGSGSTNPREELYKCRLSTNERGTCEWDDVAI